MRKILNNTSVGRTMTRVNFNLLIVLLLPAICFGLVTHYKGLSQRYYGRVSGGTPQA